MAGAPQNYLAVMKVVGVGGGGLGLGHDSSAVVGVGAAGVCVASWARHG